MLHCASISALLLIAMQFAGAYEPFRQILDKAIRNNDDISGILNGQKLPEETRMVDPCAQKKNLPDCINQKDVNGETILHRLVRDGHLPLNPHVLANLNSILDAGADPNVQNEFGRTPLHLAAENIIFDTRQKMAILLQHGANVNIEDEFNATPLTELVLQLGSFLKHKYLDQNFVKYPLPDVKMVQDMFDMLVSYGADVNRIVPKPFSFPDQRGEQDTVLDYLVNAYNFAVKHESSQYVDTLKQMIKTLIDSGARANYKATLDYYMHPRTLIKNQRRNVVAKAKKTKEMRTAK